MQLCFRREGGRKKRKSSQLEKEKKRGRNSTERTEEKGDNVEEKLGSEKISRFANDWCEEMNRITRGKMRSLGTIFTMRTSIAEGGSWGLSWGKKKGKIVRCLKEKK